MNNYNVVFGFKWMGLFLVCQGMWAMGGLGNIISCERIYLFSTPRRVFVGFCFFWN